MENNSTDTMKTYIVTGATGGIGREIVADIARSGNARIIMGVRKAQAAQRLAESLADTGAEFVTIPLNLCVLESVRAFASEILHSGWKIDGIVNNAGIMPEKIYITPDGYERATQVNYIAPKLLTEMLIPVLAKGGAVVFTTSMTRHLARTREDWDEHSRTFNGFGRRFITYGRAKRMIALRAKELAEQLSKREIRVNCADPGIVDTGMITMGNRTVDALANMLFRPIIYSPRQGARAALRALRSDCTATIFTPHGRHSMPRR